MALFKNLNIIFLLWDMKKYVFPIVTLDEAMSFDSAKVFYDSMLCRSILSHFQPGRVKNDS